MGHMIANDRYCKIQPLLNGDYDQRYWWEVDRWMSLYRNITANPNRAQYCNHVNRDFYYSRSWQYINNSCVWEFESRHVTSKSAPRSLLATTSMGSVFDPKTNDQLSVFIVPVVEKLYFRYGLDIKKQDIEATLPLYIKQPDGGYKLVELDPDGMVQFSIEEVLKNHGLTLDSNNTAPESSWDKSRPDAIRENQPTYRLSGIKIQFQLISSNFMFKDTWFDRTSRNYLEIKVDSADDKYTWSCYGWKIIDSDEATRLTGNPHLQIFAGYSCDVEISFWVSGAYCFFNWWSTLSAVVELTVLFSVATFLVDKFFGYWLRTFKVSKYSRDVDEMAATMHTHKFKRQVGVNKVIQNVQQKLELSRMSDLTSDPLSDLTSDPLRPRFIRSFESTAPEDTNHFGVTPAMEDELGDLRSSTLTVQQALALSRMTLPLVEASNPSMEERSSSLCE